MKFNELRMRFRRIRVMAYIIALTLGLVAVSFYMPLAMLSIPACIGVILCILMIDHLSNPNYRSGDGFIEVLAFGAVGLILMSQG